MKLLKNMTKLAIGVFAVLGIGSSVTACDDDNNETANPSVDDPADDPANSAAVYGPLSYFCCGKSGSETCIALSDLHGMCLTEEEKAKDAVKCCGEYDESEDWNTCIRNFKKAGTCLDDIDINQDVYGPPSYFCCNEVPEAERQTCQKLDDDFGVCITSESGKKAMDCCGDYEDTDTWKSCIEDFKESSVCSSGSDPGMEVYGPPPSDD